MTHEPECLEVGGEWDSPKFCSICVTARAAYRRGRDDAAKAIEELFNVGGGGGLLVGKDTAIAAAIGTSEQNV